MAKFGSEPQRTLLLELMMKEHPLAWPVPWWGSVLVAPNLLTGRGNSRRWFDLPERYG